METNYTNERDTRSKEELMTIATNLLCDGLEASRFIARNPHEQIIFDSIYEELREEFFPTVSEDEEAVVTMGSI